MLRYNNIDEDEWCRQSQTKSAKPYSVNKIKQQKLSWTTSTNSNNINKGQQYNVYKVLQHQQNRMANLVDKVKKNKTSNKEKVTVDKVDIVE